MGQTSYHGLMLYVHHSIKLHDVSKYSGDKMEAIKIIISKNNMKFAVVGLYKSPKASMIELISFMEKNITQLPPINTDSYWRLQFRCWWWKEQIIL